MPPVTQAKAIPVSTRKSLFGIVLLLGEFWGLGKQIARAFRLVAETSAGDGASARVAIRNPVNVAALHRQKPVASASPECPAPKDRDHANLTPHLRFLTSREVRVAALSEVHA